MGVPSLTSSSPTQEYKPQAAPCSSPPSHRDPQTPSASVISPQELASSTPKSLPPDDSVTDIEDAYEFDDPTYVGSQAHIDDLNDLSPASRVWILLHGVSPHVLPTYRGRRRLSLLSARMQRVYSYHGCGGYGLVGRKGTRCCYKPRRGSRLKFTTSPCVNKSLGEDWYRARASESSLGPSRAMSKSAFLRSLRPPSPYPPNSILAPHTSVTMSPPHTTSGFDMDAASLYCGPSDHGMGLFGLHAPRAPVALGSPTEAPTSSSSSSSSPWENTTLISREDILIH